MNEVDGMDELDEVDMDPTPGTRYEIVLRGELGDQFGVLFPEVAISRQGGTTILTGRILDQAHLVGIIDRAQELGLELIRLGPVEAADSGGQR